MQHLLATVDGEFDPAYDLPSGIIDSFEVVYLIAGVQFAMVGHCFVMCFSRCFRSWEDNLVQRVAHEGDELTLDELIDIFLAKWLD